MSGLTSSEKLSTFKNNFIVLLEEFYKTLLLFDNGSGSIDIPDACAYEFQHAMVHLAHTYKQDSRDFKARQYELACDHLDRGILDAQKLFLFSEELTACEESTGKKSIETLEHIKKLLVIRTSEYEEVKSKQVEGAILQARNFYSELANDVLKKNDRKYTIVKGYEKNLFEDINSMDKKVQEEVDSVLLFCLARWTRYELILSSLDAEKYLKILKNLIFLLSTGACTVQEIDKSTKRTAWFIIQAFKEQGLDAGLPEDPERGLALKEAVAKDKANNTSIEVINVCKTHFIEPFCGVGVNNFL